MKLIVTENIDSVGIELLKKYMEVDLKFGIIKEELKKKISDYDAIIVRSGIKYDQELLEQGVKLKAIGMAGIGLDHIDLGYAQRNDIAVFNVPDGSCDSVAELAMALILNVVRKIYPAVRSVKEEYQWDKTAYVGNQLKGKTLGIVALGKIGTRLARFAQAFDMKVLASDPYVTPEKAKSIKVELVELNDLFSQSDIISIHAPLTDKTYHMISQEQINKMKNGVYLFNLGRGPLIDEDSLYYALKKGKISACGVDVMEKEPPGSSKLFELDNFIVTPHIGSGTVEAQKYIAEEISKKILRHLKLM